MGHFLIIEAAMDTLAIAIVLSVIFISRSEP